MILLFIVGEFKMICGIYKIKNKIDNKFYIGSSTNIKQRWYRHKSMLRNNCHCNEHLQNAWNKYGENCFEFEIVCFVEKENLFEMEQKLILNLNCCDKTIGYNKTENTFAPMLGKKMSCEQKQKISDSLKGRKLSNQTKNKISNSNKGKTRTEEQKTNLSLVKKGKSIKSFKRTEENKKKISDYAKTRTGVKNSNAKLTQEQIQQICIDFEKNELSLNEIAKKYNVSLSTIKRIKYNKSYTQEKQYASV